MSYAVASPRVSYTRGFEPRQLHVGSPRAARAGRGEWKKGEVFERGERQRAACPALDRRERFQCEADRATDGRLAYHARHRPRRMSSRFAVSSSSWHRYASIASGAIGLWNR